MCWRQSTFFKLNNNKANFVYNFVVDRSSSLLALYPSCITFISVKIEGLASQITRIFVQPNNSEDVFLHFYRTAQRNVKLHLLLTSVQTCNILVMQSPEAQLEGMWLFYSKVFILLVFSLKCNSTAFVQWWLHTLSLPQFQCILSVIYLPRKREKKIHKVQILKSKGVGFGWRVVQTWIWSSKA